MTAFQFLKCFLWRYSLIWSYLGLNKLKPGIVKWLLFSFVFFCFCLFFGGGVWCFFLSIFLPLKLVLPSFIYFSCKIYSSYKSHYYNSDLYSRNNYIIYMSILLVSMCIIIHTPVPMYIMYILIVWNFLLFVTVFLDTKHFFKSTIILNLKFLSLIVISHSVLLSGNIF